jgi:zinc protease
MMRDGITDKELDDAKNYLIGSYPLKFDSNSKIADELIAIQKENLGIDYIHRRNSLIKAVKKTDIMRAMKRLFYNKALIISLVGEPNLAQMPLPYTIMPLELRDMASP